MSKVKLIKKIFGGSMRAQNLRLKTQGLVLIFAASIGVPQLVFGRDESCYIQHQLQMNIYDQTAAFEERTIGDPLGNFSGPFSDDRMILACGGSPSPGPGGGGPTGAQIVPPSVTPLTGGRSSGGEGGVASASQDVEVKFRMKASGANFQVAEAHIDLSNTSFIAIKQIDFPRFRKCGVGYAEPDCYTVNYLGLVPNVGGAGLPPADPPIEAGLANPMVFTAAYAGAVAGSNMFTLLASPTADISDNDDLVFTAILTVPTDATVDVCGSVLGNITSGIRLVKGLNSTPTEYKLGSGLTGDCDTDIGVTGGANRVVSTNPPDGSIDARPEGPLPNSPALLSSVVLTFEADATAMIGDCSAFEVRKVGGMSAPTSTPVGLVCNSVDNAGDSDPKTVRINLKDTNNSDAGLKDDAMWVVIRHIASNSITWHGRHTCNVDGDSKVNHQDLNKFALGCNDSPATLNIRQLDFNRNGIVGTPSECGITQQGLTSDLDMLRVLTKDPNSCFNLPQLPPKEVIYSGP